MKNNIYICICLLLVISGTLYNNLAFAQVPQYGVRFSVSTGVAKGNCVACALYAGRIGKSDFSNNNIGQDYYYTTYDQKNTYTVRLEEDPRNLRWSYEMVPYSGCQTNNSSPTNFCSFRMGSNIPIYQGPLPRGTSELDLPWIDGAPSLFIKVEYSAPEMTMPTFTNGGTIDIICANEVEIATTKWADETYIWEVARSVAGPWIAFATTSGVSGNRVTLRKSRIEEVLADNNIIGDPLQIRVKPNAAGTSWFDRTSPPAIAVFKSNAPQKITSTVELPTCPNGDDGKIVISGLKNSDGSDFQITGDLRYTILSKSTGFKANIETTDKTVVFNKASIVANGGNFGISIGEWEIQVEGVGGSCVSSSTFKQTVNAPASIAIPSLSVTAPVCIGGTGEISLSVVNDKAPFTYTLINSSGVANSIVSNQRNYTFSNLIPGDYTINARGCGPAASTGVLKVEEPNVVKLLPLVATNTSCSEINNGSILANVSGGKDPYQISLNGAAYIAVLGNTHLFTGLASANYNVTVRDANFCTSTQLVAIGTNAPVTAIVQDDDIHDATCAGANNGHVYVKATGAEGVTFEYSLNGGIYQTLNAFDNLTAGSYSISVRDANASVCRWDSTIEIKEPLPIVFDELFISEAITCFGENSGELTVSASGGSPQFGYTYTLINKTSGEPIDVITTSLTASFGLLVAGTYRIDASDGVAGCVVTKEIELTQPDQLIFNSTISNYHGSNVSCAESVDGNISFASTGGIYPHTIRVAGRPDQILNSNETVNFSSFKAGEYQFTILDNSGSCQRDTMIRFVAPQPLTIELTPKLYGDDFNVSCNGSSNGILSAEASGGTMPYSYSISPLGVPQEYVNVTNDSVGFEQLSVGLYTVIIKDINNCQVQSQEELIGPDELVVSAIQVPDFYGYQLSCNGDKDAEVAIFTKGGSYPQKITLTGHNQEGETSATNVGVDFTELGAGSYTFQVVDEEGCSTEGNFELVQPDQLILNESITVMEKPDCAGQRTGSLQLQAVGGIKIDAKDYHYSLKYLGDRTRLPFSYPEVQTLNGDLIQFNDLVAGTYQLTINDQVGCLFSKTVVINTNNQVTVNLTTKDVTCKSDKDGLAEMVISGGVSPYIVDWKHQQNILEIDEVVLESELASVQNLGEGLYDFVVSDANGCTYYNGNFSFQIEGPSDSLILQPIINQVRCNGENNGTVILGATGGWQESSYKYGTDVNNLLVNHTIYEDLAPGVYMYYAQDAKGCIKEVEVTITEPEILKSEISSIDMVSCFGQNDGSFELAIEGGTTPYRLSIDGGNTWMETNTMSLLGANTYGSQIQDANNCSFLQDVTITEPAALEAKVVSIENTLCKESNGSATVNVTGGTMPYIYSWLDNTNASIDEDLTANNLLAGKYTFKVTDENNCVNELPVEVINTNDIVFEVRNVEGVTCFGYANGKAELSITQVQSPYTISWDNGAITNSVSNLSAGERMVTLVDANDCEVSQLFLISTPDSLSLQVTKQNTPTCYGECNGLLEVSASGGTGIYSYQWSNGNSTNSLSNACAGEHVLMIRDANSCELQKTIALQGPIENKLGIEDSTFHICQGQKVFINLEEWKNHSWSSSNGFSNSHHSVSLTQAGEYNVSVVDAFGCTGNAEFKVIYSNDLLKAEFLIPKETYIGDTVVCVNISNPQPDKLVWNYDKNKAVSLIQKDSYQELVFMEEGQYVITLTSHLGGCTAQQSKTINVLKEKEDQATNIRLGYEEKGIKDLKVFPNPNDGLFSCEVLLYKIGDIHIRVVDMYGKLVSEHHQSNADQFTTDINITDQPAGIYWLVVEGNEDVRTFKVLVKQN